MNKLSEKEIIERIKLRYTNETVLFAEDSKRYSLNKNGSNPGTFNRICKNTQRTYIGIICHKINDRTKEEHGLQYVSLLSLMFNNDHSCPKCGHEETGKKQSIDYTGKKFNNLLALKRIYKNKKYYYECKCDCGNLYTVSGSNLVSNHVIQCSDCSYKQISVSNTLCKNIKESFAYNYPELLKEWNYELNKDINPYTIYPVGDLFVWWKCLKCGTIYNTVIKSRTRNKTGCPYCKESHGEKRIKKYLDENRYNYIPQFRFKNCKNKNPLPFDFAIFNDKEKTKLKCLIEYDGEQHYYPISRFGGIEGFKKVKMNDNIKDKYCKDNNINLLRISYLEDNIENTIKSNVYN